MNLRPTSKNTGRFVPPVASRFESTYKKSVLTNGVRVVTEEISHVRSLSLGFWFENGSRHERPEQNGISHFIEHMVFKGTKKRNVKEIAQSIESVGGYLNAFTSKEHTCYYARVLDENLELAMDVLSDMVFSPTFIKKELEKEKNVVLEELKQEEDDPDDCIHDEFEKQLFQSHPLAMPVLGTAETISSFRQKDLFRFKDERYRPENLVIAAAGHLAHHTVVKLAERYCGKNERGAEIRVADKQGPIAIPSAKTYEQKKPVQQAHVCLGIVGCSVRDDRRFALQVLNTLLGDGMSSRLFQNIREKYGFAYSIYSFSNLMQETGTVGVYVGTDNSHVQHCIELVWKELNSLRNHRVSSRELALTKAQLKGSLMLGMENIPSRMTRLGSSELYLGDLVRLETIIARIEAVTQKEIQTLAEQLFDESHFVSVIFHSDGRHHHDTEE